MPYFFLCLLFFSFSSLSATETKTISDWGFQNIWLWQLSNTTINNKQEISLSKNTSSLYKTKETLWTVNFFKDAFYLGTANTASIIKLNKNFSNSTLIYDNTDKSIITSIKSIDKGFLAVSAPEAEILHFDETDTLITNIALSNNYVWDIIDNPQGGQIILASVPAQIYNYQNNILSELLTLPDEEHLLKGIFIDNDLWILSEKNLYKKSGNKITAIASFNGTAADFIYLNDTFYIVQSTVSPLKTEDKKDIILSFLYSVKKDGTASELLSIPGFYFVSISAHDQNIMIGADQSGMFIEYNPNDKSHRFGTLGDGKIFKIFSQDNDTALLITSDPSGISKLDNTSAVKGEFISEIYDTTHISDWGTFYAEFSKPEQTDIRFFVQSGVTPNPIYWQDWYLITNNQVIPSPSGTYIRYKAELSAKGKKKPTVSSIEFTYTQKNIAPYFTDAQIERKDNNINIQWTADDPNNDTLHYDMYLTEKNSAPIKLNIQPLTNTNFSFGNSCYPSGWKTIILSVSDLPSNTKKTALTNVYEFPPIMFDSEAPIISDIVVNSNQNHWDISFSVTDSFSIIKKVSYYINGELQQALLPQDGIFDRKHEEFFFSIPKGKNMFLQIQSLDNANNKSSKGIQIK